MTRGPHALLAFGAATVVAAAAAGSCASVTEIVVVVDGDVRGADTVVVRVESTDGFTRERSVRPSDVPLPLTLGVSAGSDEAKAFTVYATANRGDDVVVARTVRARLVPGESRVVAVDLCASCAGVTCGGETSCRDGACAPIDDARDLPEWSGSPPSHRCGPSTAGDAGVEGGDAGPIVKIDGVYHLVDDPRSWSSFDLATEVSPALVGYLGAGFDGAYVYFAPSFVGAVEHGNVARFDTGKPFDDPSAWSAFDLTLLGPKAKGYSGVATFGRDYVYFVPYSGGGGDVVARLKVGEPFGATSSWSTIALGSHLQASGAAGFGGAVVNQSHVWLPARKADGSFVLHDNRLAGDPLDAGWEKVDVRSVDAGSVPGGYFGGAYDGDAQMYFAPWSAGGIAHGVALKRVVGAAGGAAAGWTSFDLTTLPNGDRLRGYAGGAFDGRFVYFVPYANASGNHGNVVRVDTGKAFDAASSWETIDLAAQHPDLAGFIGAVFDGRFLLFVPSFSGLVARYDTTKPFGDPASWSRFDLTTVGGPSATRYAGGAFDGKYVYLAPAGRSPVLRFDARDPRDTTSATARGSFL